MGVQYVVCLKLWSTVRLLLTCSDCSIAKFLPFKHYDLILNWKWESSLCVFANNSVRFLGSVN